MLSPLLVALLCAAPDSASPVPVPAQETSIQASSVASTPTPASAVGPLVRGSWGLGFRVLGNGQNLLLRRALTDRMSAGVKVGWGGSFDEAFSQEGNRSTVANDFSSRNASWSLQEDDYFSADLGLPVEWLLKSHRSLRLAVSAGPVFEWVHRSSKATESRRGAIVSESVENPPVTDEMSGLTLGLGLAGSVGLRWFFLPDLAVAADFGTSAVWSHTTVENTTESTWWSSYEDAWITQEYQRESEYDRVSTNLVFLGVGLEAWF